MTDRENPFLLIGKQAAEVLQPFRPPVNCAKGVAVELNRNQYFFIGVLFLLIGVQNRMVASYTLNDEATRFLAERSQQSSTQATLVSFSSDMGALPKKVIHPPDWLGYCLLSVGSVFVLHSLAMKKPGG